jgi:hypothetical protein
MVKKQIFILFIFISCKAVKPEKICHENLQFKQVFFSHIEIIDKNITISQDEKFRESVIFISNYAPISVEQIMNYSRSYPLGIYKIDRKKWFEWYEENKCFNIQFKDLNSIPEVYQE